MSVGSMVSVGYLLKEAVPYAIELTLGLLLAAEFFITWLLRELQGSGTNFKIVLGFLVLLLVALILNIIANPSNCKYGMQIAG